jgi:DNA-binding transcriptional regulator GbsR (MarR family)
MNNQNETQFIESLGLILQAEGFPRIAGRLLGVFVLRGGPLSFQELSESLQISRGSVSTNTRLLESLGAVERVTMAGERQDYFRLADTPYERMAAGKVERAKQASERLLKGRDALSSCDDATFERVTELSDFFSSISHACSVALAEMQSSRTNAQRPRVVAGE